MAIAYSKAGRSRVEKSMFKSVEESLSKGPPEEVITHKRPKKGRVITYGHAVKDIKAKSKKGPWGGAFGNPAKAVAAAEKTLKTAKAPVPVRQPAPVVRQRRRGLVTGLEGAPVLPKSDPAKVLPKNISKTSLELIAKFKDTPFVTKDAARVYKDLRADPEYKNVTNMELKTIVNKTHPVEKSMFNSVEESLRKADKKKPGMGHKADVMAEGLELPAPSKVLKPKTFMDGTLESKGLWDNKKFVFKLPSYSTDISQRSMKGRRTIVGYRDTKTGKYTAYKEPITIAVGKRNPTSDQIHQMIEKKKAKTVPVAQVKTRSPSAASVAAKTVPVVQVKTRSPSAEKVKVIKEAGQGGLFSGKRTGSEGVPTLSEKFTKFPIWTPKSRKGTYVLHSDPKVKGVTQVVGKQEKSMFNSVENSMFKGVLSTEDREDLKEKQFALPKKAEDKEEKAESGNYPIPDLSHARNALAMVAQHGTPAEQAQVRAAVYKKYPELDKRKEGEEMEKAQRPKLGGPGYATRREAIFERLNIPRFIRNPKTGKEIGSGEGAPKRPKKGAPKRPKKVVKKEHTGKAASTVGKLKSFGGIDVEHRELPKAGSPRSSVARAADFMEAADKAKQERAADKALTVRNLPSNIKSLDPALSAAINEPIISRGNNTRQQIVEHMAKSFNTGAPVFVEEPFNGRLRKAVKPVAKPVQAPDPTPQDQVNAAYEDVMRGLRGGEGWYSQGAVKNLNRLLKTTGVKLTPKQQKNLEVVGSKPGADSPAHSPAHVPPSAIPNPGIKGSRGVPKKPVKVEPHPANKLLAQLRASTGGKKTPQSVAPGREVKPRP